jgi:hypothetical protein
MQLDGGLCIWMLVSIMYSYFMATGLTHIIVIDVNHPNIGGIGDFLFC